MHLPSEKPGSDVIEPPIEECAGFWRTYDKMQEIFERKWGFLKKNIKVYELEIHGNVIRERFCSNLYFKSNQIKYIHIYITIYITYISNQNVQDEGKHFETRFLDQEKNRITVLLDEIKLQGKSR